MPGFAVRTVLLVLTLWLGACGAGGNNNIFDLNSAGRGAGDRTVLRVGIDGKRPGAHAVPSIAVAGVVNRSASADSGAGGSSQS